MTKHWRGDAEKVTTNPGKSGQMFLTPPGDWHGGSVCRGTQYKLPGLASRIH